MLICDWMTMRTGGWADLGSADVNGDGGVSFAHTAKYKGAPGVYFLWVDAPAGFPDWHRACFYVGQSGDLATRLGHYASRSGLTAARVADGLVKAAGGANGRGRIHGKVVTQVEVDSPDSVFPDDFPDAGSPLPEHLDLGDTAQRLYVEASVLMTQVLISKFDVGKCLNAITVTANTDQALLLAHREERYEAIRNSLLAVGITP